MNMDLILHKRLFLVLFKRLPFKWPLDTGHSGGQYKQAVWTQSRWPHNWGEITVSKIQNHIRLRQGTNLCEEVEIYENLCPIFGLQQNKWKEKVETRSRLTWILFCSLPVSANLAGDRKPYIIEKTSKPNNWLYKISWRFRFQSDSIPFSTDALLNASLRKRDKLFWPLPSGIQSSLVSIISIPW